MTQVGATTALGPSLIATPMPAGPDGAGSVAMPEPLVRGEVPSDVLAMMLTAMDRMSRMSMDRTEVRIQSAKMEMREQLDKYMEQLRAALEAARQKQEEEDDGGWFGGVVDAVAGAVGTIVGTLVDFAVDVVTLPVDVAVGVARNIGDPQAMFDMVKGEIIQLGENSDTAESVKGFVKGVAKFAGSLGTFLAEVGVAVAAAAARGESLGEAVKAQARELWGSFKANILENPAFWEVTGTLVKVAAVAMAAMSGGTLGAVAVMLFVAAEADNRYGLSKDLLGEKNAAWVQMGLQVGAAVCCGMACSGDTKLTLQLIQGATAAAQGAHAVYMGVKTIEQGERLADGIDREAEMRATLHRMQQLQRLLDGLLEELGEQNEDRSAQQELGNRIVQTQAAAQTAAVMRA